MDTLDFLAPDLIRLILGLMVDSDDEPGEGARRSAAFWRERLLDSAFRRENRLNTANYRED